MLTNLEAAVQYKAHWENGNEEGLVGVISDDYIFRILNLDADETVITIKRADFVKFLQEFKADVGQNSDGKLMKILGILSEELNRTLILTCYWETLGGKSVRGTGQISVKDGKVTKEVVSIF